MITSYYNLKEIPFQKDIKSKDMFISKDVLELSQRFEYMKQKRGIMLITGMPGNGKTLNIRSFVEKLNLNNYMPIYIPLSTVNITDFYRQICIKLGEEPYFKKAQLFESIQKGIKNYVQNHKKIPVIIFDEAHHIKNENFYELQIISNFNMDSSDPAIFIIVGQPHLRDRLLRPIHQSFNQRISLKFHFNPLSKEETESYINHHMSLAGSKDQVFNKNACGVIYQNSNGYARVINGLAIKSLMIGATEKKDIITEEEVYRASKEL